MARPARVKGKNSKSNGMVRHVIDMVHRVFSLCIGRSPYNGDLCDDEEVNCRVAMSKDVNDGHFPVVAINNCERRRFVVALSYLTHSEFIRLLRQAEAEFGFQQGVIAIPCHPSELERVLSESLIDYEGDGDSGL